MNESRIENLQEIVTAIQKNHRFLIATHIRPDGDAVGSVLALTFMLRRLGKRADPHCQDPAPNGLDFLPGVSSIRHHVTDPSVYDVAILVDCADFLRVGPVLAESIRQVPFVINIDHHVSMAPVGNIDWVDAAASSTCEMLYNLCVSLPLVPDAQIASQLYTGLLTDTGSFRFSNTTQRVLEIATQLVGAGAQPAAIAEHIYDSDPPQRLRLLAQVLATVAFHADDRLSTAALTQQMFKETNTSPMDSEGFINHLRSVKSVRMAMLFREDKDGMVHVSMRSRGDVDVASFAQRYKGGGHRHAAACRVPGNVDTIRSAMTAEALKHVNLT